MKVIDSSALIKYLTKEENWQKIENHIKEGCATLNLAIKETANALIKKTIKNEVDIKTAKQIIVHLSRIVKIMPQKEQFEKALEISIKHKITIYDALFIALATNTNQPLITSDRKQAETSKKCDVITTLI